MDALVRSLGRFLARDFVFIVAGSAAILTFCYVFDRLWILEMPNALYFVAAGFAYVVGYAIQDLVSLTGLFTTADLFKPARLAKAIYRRFEGHEWREIEPFDTAAVRSELDRSPDQGGVPEGTRLRFERLVSLRMLGSAVGSSSLLSCALLVYRAWQFREPFDVGLAVALLLLGSFFNITASSASVLSTLVDCLTTLLDFGMPVLTNILIQFEMIELIEGFLLVFPSHVGSSFLRGCQHPIVGSISRGPAG